MGESIVMARERERERERGDGREERGWCEKEFSDGERAMRDHGERTDIYKQDVNIVFTIELQCDSTFRIIL